MEFPLRQNKLTSTANAKLQLIYIHCQVQLGETTEYNYTIYLEEFHFQHWFITCCSDFVAHVNDRIDRR